MPDPDPAPGAGEDQGIASTNGWDTVAAITYTEVNEGPHAARKLPETLQPGSGRQVGRCQRRFHGLVDHDRRLWRENLHGAYDHQRQARPRWRNTEILRRLGGDRGPIRVCAAAGKTERLDLKVSTAAPVSVPSANFKGLSRMYAGAAKDLIAVWLNNNMAEFNNIFATVNLDRELVKDGIPWLAPSFQGYAVAEPMKGATLDNSAFGVMCLIDGRQPGAALAEQISPFAIPDGHKAGFLISEDKFLDHIMLPGLATLFKGLEDKKLTDYFDVVSNGTQIQNKTKLTMRDYKLGDMTVAPIVEAKQFQIACSATELKLSVYDMWFDVPLFGVIHEALTAKITYNGRYRMRLDDKGHTLALDIIQEVQFGRPCQQSGLDDHADRAGEPECDRLRHRDGLCDWCRPRGGRGGRRGCRRGGRGCVAGRGRNRGIGRDNGRGGLCLGGRGNERRHVSGCRASASIWLRSRGSASQQPARSASHPRSA